MTNRETIRQQVDWITSEQINPLAIDEKLVDLITQREAKAREEVARDICERILELQQCKNQKIMRIRVRHYCNRILEKITAAQVAQKE